jgi:hypothetical protein
MLSTHGLISRSNRWTLGNAVNELPHGMSRGDEDRQEIRLALVMTGGVSLAVWMGGVAGEIYRATHFDDLYGELRQRAPAWTF